MRLTAIPSEFYKTSPTITVSETVHPKLTNVELPLVCTKPMTLRANNGKTIVAYLVNYKNWCTDLNNVELTRHCLYVTKEVWDNVCAQINALTKGAN